MPSAILLISHGSRREEANHELVALAEMLRTRCPDEIVEFAYLELVEPTIPQGARRCIERGATDVSLLPFFLSPGAHVSEDLEQYRQHFEREYPQATFTVCPPLGLHPKIVDVLVERLQEGKLRKQG